VKVGNKMAVTKTNFMNYIRCPRYVALDEVHKEKLNADVSLSEYKALEKCELLNGLVESMYDDESDEDLIDITNEQLEVMMSYYKKIETLAGKLVNKKLEGTPKYSDNTYNQECFETNINGIKYLCYVDIYNDRKESFDIIEVKATTTKGFLKLGNKVNGEHVSIFTKDKNGIYRLLDEAGYEFDDYKYDKYLEQKKYLTKRFHDVGHYVYDLAVQRYIIEKDLGEDLPKDVRYYLAVLNNEYVYDGISDYKLDEAGNEIISLIDLTEVTKGMMDKIDLDRQSIEKYVFDCDIHAYKLGNYCEHKKITKCKFCSVCFKSIPKVNSIFNYIDGHHGFKDEEGNKYERFDLVNDGKVSILDVPPNYLNRRKNQIQRGVVETDEIFIDEEKIKKGIENIAYPIYHLDFETFPCPLPRHKGEKPYSQSVFQFSIHVERAPGICDEDKDHYGYLAPNLEDHREELIRKMLEYIKDDDGTILVYNESFEKTRLKELADIFPEYKKDLLKIRDRIFDLLFLIKSNTEFYQGLGYSNEEAKLFNYYHKDLSGSFSIKKVLPVLSESTYEGMMISDGMEALTTFAKFPTLSKEEFALKYQALLDYCKQDTWSMVVILESLRKTVNLGVKEAVKSCI